MPDDMIYRVTEAILVRRGSGSAWTLTFSPLPAERGAPFDPDAGKQVVVTVSSEVVEEMSFDVNYTRAEIDALQGDPTST